MERARKGEDFAKLAKENSDDPGSKDKGGEYDFFSHGKMVPEFEKAAFETKAVSFAYRDVPALNHLSLHVRQGERVALMGVNGSGKSLHRLDAANPAINAAAEYPAVAQEMEKICRAFYETARYLPHFNSPDRLKAEK